MKYLALVAGVTIAATAVGAQEVAPQDVVFEDGAISASLSGAAGDPAAGRDIFKNRKQGNCLACHLNSEMPEELFHGEVGPPLDGVADRWEVSELRGIVSNAKMTFDDTIMPAFYRDTGVNRPLDKFANKSILTAQQVEDVIAYLTTLKE